MEKTLPPLTELDNKIRELSEVVKTKMSRLNERKDQLKPYVILLWILFILNNVLAAAAAILSHFHAVAGSISGALVVLFTNLHSFVETKTNAHQLTQYYEGMISQGQTLLDYESAALESDDGVTTKNDFIRMINDYLKKPYEPVIQTRNIEGATIQQFFEGVFMKIKKPLDADKAERVAEEIIEDERNEVTVERKRAIMLNLIDYKGSIVVTKKGMLRLPDPDSINV
ncbi:hypothetical protein MP638_006212 [Amoeboaphelidium occidentale]|nr:hypothetical protein MP638_006212 [Amoeboaphelidium occidentale]